LADGERRFNLDLLWRDAVSVPELPATARLARRVDDAGRLAAHAVADRPLSCQAPHVRQPVGRVLATAARRFTLERRVEIDGETVRITDVLRDRDNALSPEMIVPELAVCGAAASLPAPMFAKASMLRVTKTIDASEPEPQLEVELGHG
jgi:hypothetical protein